MAVQLKPGVGKKSTISKAKPAPRPDALYLIDASSYIHRAYHALPPLTTSRGVPTGAVYGFTQMLIKLVREERPGYLAVVWDRGQSGRRELFADYKKDRQAPADDLAAQFPTVKRVVESFELPEIALPGFEADDVIATLVRQATERGLPVTIVTIDKDMMQLCTPRVELYDTMRERRFGPDEVKERYGVTPEQLGDVLALMGDSSDSIPGVPGIGEKTAAQLINQFGNLETLLSRIDEVKGDKRKQMLREHTENARLSRRLVALMEDLPVALDLDALRLREPDPARLRPLFRELEFTKLEQGLSPKIAIERERYQVILDEPALVEMARAARQAGELSLKVVTTQQNPVRDPLVGLAVALPPAATSDVPGEPPRRRVYYVPVSHRSLTGPRQLAWETVRAVVGPLLEDPTLAKVVVNTKFEHAILYRHGLELHGVRTDPMMASYLLDPKQGGAGHELPELAREHLEHTVLAYNDVCGSGQKQIGFDEVEIPRAAAYAGEAAECALILAERLHPRLTEPQNAGLLALLYDVELPLARVLAKIELAGMAIDLDVLAAQNEKVGADLALLEAEIHAMAGFAFNIQSTPQLRELLFEKLGLRPKKRTKTGYSTDVDSLEEMAKMHPLPAKIVEYRQLAKLKNTYLDALPRMVNPATGRIHTTYNQAVAATGRLSSTEPNLQNIPIRTELGRQIRQAFVGSNGRLILSADYSQVELRVLAHLSRDPVLLDAFAHDQDVHTRTAAEVLHKRPEEVTPEERSAAKATNFGILYGQGEFGLSQALGISRQEAAAYIAVYRERLGGVETFMQEVIARAKAGEPVRTLMGRQRHLPDLRSSNPRNRAAAERIARNTPIQGSAADILKVAMVAIDRRFVRESLDRVATMVCTVHDELIFEVEPSAVDVVTAAVRSEMQGAATLAVPLKVDVGVAPSWGSAH